MQFDNHSNRSGMTLIETLVSLAIIGILAALLIPAVQAVRKASRRTHCQNNSRQTALALHSYHTSLNNLPSPYSGTSLNYPLTELDLFHLHSWRAALLPYLEQSALRDSIDWDSLATDRANELVATTVVPVYICPSGKSPSANLMRVPHSSHDQDYEYPVVRSDYDGLAGIWDIFNEPPVGTLDGDTNYLRWSVWGSGTFDNGTVSGNLVRYDAGQFKDVTDGLSNTIMLVERGGRPVHMVDGQPKITPYNPNAEYPGQIAWSASNPFIWRVNFRDVGVNHDNADGIYSEHAGGANVALADGSVTFLSESTDITTLAMMIGRADGEH